MIRPLILHVTSQQGRRPSNEDVERYVVNMAADGYNINSEYAPIDLFIICDGHGGSQVSKFIAPKLEKMLIHRRLKYPLSYNHVRNIYKKVNFDLSNDANNIGEECGTTALVVARYLDHRNQDSLQVINLGDCRAVLSRNGNAIPLTKDHKPSWTDEKIRINEINAKLEKNKRSDIIFEEGDWRINGLSVSRVFGDFSAKPHVTYIPESFIYELDPSDEFIIIACDGLWDVMQNNEAVNFVRDHIYNLDLSCYNILGSYPSREVKNTKCLARKLASYAIAKGSYDNVSIIIVFFGKD